MLKELQVPAFFVASGYHDLKFWPQMVYMLKHWPEIRKEAEAGKRGTCWTVKMNGKIEPLRNL